jgi:coenzyme F420-reducing hydrogenase alpha subunit
MSAEREIAIHVPVLARVEGEGALDLRARGNRIEEVRLRIFEPPRFFEKFLEGREHFEVPDMVARICGICPVAYQMSAVQAIERAFGVDPGDSAMGSSRGPRDMDVATADWVRAMRRVMYCGEWIESHALHIHLLAAPDFLGFTSAIEMAQQHPAEVRRGLMLQNLGNELIRLLGGRSVHPVGVCVGGFHRAPSLPEVHRLLEQLRAALPDAEALLAWTAALPLPESNQAVTSVAMRHPNEYPMYEGRIVSNAGLDIDVADYERHFEESQVAHSTALYSLHNGEPYLVGPLARLHLNLDRLPAPVARALAACGIRFPTRNMYHSIVARAAEILLALHEAIRLLSHYELPASPRVAVRPLAAVGYGATEAPRGLLWHRYELDGEGHVRAARIVPPTSQNQARIEQDLRQSLEEYGLAHSDDELRLRAETVIRNYDPCISCATHFLTLRVRRE